MCPFYNAQLFEITGTTKGVFTHSQSSCHIAKVILALRHDSRQIPIASDAPPRDTSRGFLVWALSSRRFNRRQVGASFVSFFVRSKSPFLRPDLHLACRWRAQKLSRLAVAPTLSDKLRRCQGHTLTASSTTARLVRSG